MLQEVGFLPESLRTVFALEWFFSRMRPQMYLDVGFVEESAVTNLTMMHHFLVILIKTSHAGRSAAAASASADSTVAASSGTAGQRPLSDFLGSFDLKSSQFV